ncbi:hypothetical protein ACFV9G_13630 [Nocardioides sp. NPDC059952]|uniref:hypothetical protein n=1 Tax=Nocardioides sp. NPDC059952 TaxID=3347014 RepID=UPI003661A0A2
MTGALEVPMSKTEAEKITMSIKLLLGSLADVTDKVFDQIEKAEAGDAWKALDYRSWTAYVTAEFGDALRRLDRGGRFLAIVRMRELGMSTRAIGEVVGAGKSTVARELAGVPNGTPGSSAGEESSSPEAPVTGKDGKTYPRRRKLQVLPSGKPDAASTEDMGRAVPPVTKRKSPVRRSSSRRPVGVRLRQVVAEVDGMAEAILTDDVTLADLGVDGDVVLRQMDEALAKWARVRDLLAEGGDDA